jgi:predicted RNase H-like nuclease
MGPESDVSDTTAAYVVGVDACPGGWVAVALRGGRFAGADMDPVLAVLLTRVPEAVVVAVDIPLGLLEAGRRRADELALGQVAPHRARVFPVPPRPVWEEPDYGAANERCRRLTGSGLSRQSWGLVTKLREANACREGGERRLYEVHPEVSFAAMNGGRPVARSKKSWNGQAQRRRLLGEQGIVLPDELGPAGRVPPDDVLDAASAAWSAHRIALDTAVSLPDPPETTRDGLPVAIWY